MHCTPLVCLSVWSSVPCVPLRLKNGKVQKAQDCRASRVKVTDQFCSQKLKCRCGAVQNINFTFSLIGAAC